MISRREVLASILGASSVYANSSDANCSFWVFGLLKPTRLSLRPTAANRLYCLSPERTFITEAGQSTEVDLNASTLSASGPNGADTSFELEIPNTFSRRYFGTIRIEGQSGILVPVVSMPIDIAVGSIVAAELPLIRAPLESLWAQAIVARSFLLASRAARHPQASFCDTTHCQFLKSPALAGSRVSKAVESTAGLLLTNRAMPFPPSYSAACGGRTECGERDGFFYKAVDCLTCRKGRLERRGHGWGLCQEGAMDLARQGLKGSAILARYYPGTSLRYV